YKVSYETGEKTLYRVWFCKSRLCPMCNWRRAMKHGIQSQKVVAEVIKQKPTVRWLFLTLTVRNVYDGTELNKSLSDMSKGINRMMKYKTINKNIVGFMRATEVTVKYPVKDTDFMTDDEERNLQRLADLEEGLYRKRLISYGGLLKEIHKELNLDDAEDGDLIHTDDEEKADEDGFSIIAMWNWER